MYFIFLLSLVYHDFGDFSHSAELRAPHSFFSFPLFLFGGMRDGSALRAPSYFAEAVRQWKERVDGLGVGT